MLPSDVRSSEASAQNARCKNFQKFTCSNFRGFLFRGSYFRISVMGREYCENLDLAKISRYTVGSGVVGSGVVGSGVMNGEIGGMVTSVSSSSVNQIIENIAHTHKNNYIC